MDMGDYAKLSSYIQYVAYYKSYWYTWSYVPTIHTNECWQLGRFNSAGTYQLLFCWGQPPQTGGVTPSGWNSNLFSPDTQPYNWDMALASGTLFWNEPSDVWKHIKSFYVDEQNDEIVMSSGADAGSGAYGMEVFGIRINVTELLAGRTYFHSELITKPAVYNPGTSLYEIDTQWFHSTIDTTDINGYMAVKVTNDHQGDASFTPQTKLVANMFATGTFGTIKEPGLGDVDNKPIWHFSLFVDENTNSVTVDKPLSATNDANPFTLNWTVKAYAHPAGLQEIVGANSTPEIKQSGDTYSPTKNTYTYLPGNDLEKDFELADEVNPTSTVYTDTKGVTYSHDQKKYLFSVITQANAGDGIYLFDRSNTNADKLTRIQSSGSDLANDWIGDILQISERWTAIVSDDGAGTGAITNVAIQFYDLLKESFSDYE